MAAIFFSRRADLASKKDLGNRMKLALLNRQDDPRTASILAVAFRGRRDGASCGNCGRECDIDMKNILSFDSGKLPKFQHRTCRDRTAILKQYENTFYIIFNSKITKCLSAGTVNSAGFVGTSGPGWDLQ